MTSTGEETNTDHELISDKPDPMHNFDGHLEFIRPSEGTPAAEALAANKMIEVSKVTKAYHKIRTMKRPKMKNFNIVKKLNKVTKQKKLKKHFSKNFKGKVIDGVHELFVLTAGIMLGIKCSIVNTDSIIQASSLPGNTKAVTAPDFDQIEKVSFPPKGSSDESPYPTPSHDLAHTFTFKSYAPQVFHRLRSYFDIPVAAYMESICGNYNYVEFISNSKSGQFFFYSHDGRYLLKTQTKEENKFLLDILPEYYQYLHDNPHSLLCRILGMHRIEMYHLRRKVHFVVMTSVFDTPNKIERMYDLKGSLVGRNASQEDRDQGCGVWKDNDLLADKVKIKLGEKKRALIQQLEKDTQFLAKLNIMDYSLIVGIHDRASRPIIPASNENIMRRHSQVPVRRNTETMIQVLPSAGPSPINSPSSADHADHEKSDNLIQKKHHHSPSSSTKPAAHLLLDSPSSGDVRMSDNPAFFINVDMTVNDQDQGQTTSSVSRIIYDDFGSIDEYEELSDVEEDDEEDEDDDDGSVYEDIDAGDSDVEGEQDSKTIPVVDKTTHSPTTGSHPWTSRVDSGINSRNPDGSRGSEIYYMGVIDILQRYNINKRAETLFKGISNSLSQISSIHPNKYARRFIQFMDDNSV